MNNKQKILFAITADYRPQNPHKPKYYIQCETAKQAKQIFKNYVTWLKIYNVEPCDEETTKRIIAEPEKYLFRGGFY